MPLRRLLPIAVAALLAFAMPALAQGTDEIAAVQAWLNGEGYDAGPADGLMGGRTRQAIEQWESEHGRPATGAVSPELVALATDTAPETVADEPAASTTAESAVTPLAGDSGQIAGTGGLAFSENADGTLVITDGFPWRPAVSVTSRRLVILSTQFGLFETSPESLVPVPLDDSVVDVPGSTFVPLFLAGDRDAALRGSLADATGVTWWFQSGQLRFELDDYVLVADEAGASIAFGTDGVVLEGFTLLPR